MAFLAARQNPRPLTLQGGETMANQQDSAHPDTHVQVVVITTSGSYPETGSDTVPAHQKVRQELKAASEALKLADTTGWVARVDGREIDPENSYIDNHLSGQVKIDFGPREGGGGCA
jgi:hypothetical protein